MEDSQDSGNEDEEAEDAEEDPAIETSLPIIVEEDADEATKHTSWLPLPGSLPPEVSSQTNSPKASLRSAPVSFLHPNATFAHEVIEEEDEEGTGSPDLNYNLRGDMDDERKYYIYKVNNVNMIPKKECLGKVVVPPGSISTKVKASAGVTLEELRLMIRNSNDEMLQDAAKQRFRYLSESYHLVALDEAFTPVDQLYPDSGYVCFCINQLTYARILAKVRVITQRYSVQLKKNFISYYIYFLLKLLQLQRTVRN